MHIKWKLVRKGKLKTIYFTSKMEMGDARDNIYCVYYYESIV